MTHKNNFDVVFRHGPSVLWLISIAIYCACDWAHYGMFWHIIVPIILATIAQLLLAMRYYDIFQRMPIGARYGSIQYVERAYRDVKVLFWLIAVWNVLPLREWVDFYSIGPVVGTFGAIVLSGLLAGFVWFVMLVVGIYEESQR